jgi:ApaG protein
VKYSVLIDPTPFYLADQSEPEKGVFTFAYHINIVNTGDVPVQLVSRHWIITDADGRVEEVKGEGVVGKQPTLAPGESFQYTSGTNFKSPVGTMHGSYQFVAEDGTKFDAPIPRFTCSAKRVLH